MNPAAHSLLKYSSGSLIFPLTHTHLCKNYFSHHVSARNIPPSQGSGVPASAKLFEDAQREEAEEGGSRPASSRTTLLDTQHENWTGEESVRDAVLRMLVDKYKPLRGGTIRSAEEKLKQAPPQILGPSTLASAPDAPLADKTAYTNVSTPSIGSWASETLIAPVEGHKPWHTTYKAPSHATASVRVGQFSSAITRPSSVADPLDDRARKRERDAKKKTEHVGRLTRAKESTLDYRLGLRNIGARGHAGIPNPISLKGWTSLIEDKIEKARMAGLFKSVKGRGKPLVQKIEEANPFIAREEFLMNRIVQRNGAAPPWVEVQGELESAIRLFREMLRQSWTRRAIRNLTTYQPAALLSSLTLSDIQSLRDADWETRERSYHETALEEVNALVRKYNGMAPYAVRRPYYTRSTELERVYGESGDDILRGLEERARDQGNTLRGRGGGYSGEKEHAISGISRDLGPSLRIWAAIRSWVERWIRGRR